LLSREITATALSPLFCHGVLRRRLLQGFLSSILRTLARVAGEGDIPLEPNIEVAQYIGVLKPEINNA
jgi:hypothetical protein